MAVLSVKSDRRSCPADTSYKVWLMLKVIYNFGADSKNESKFSCVKRVIATHKPLLEGPLNVVSFWQRYSRIIHATWYLQEFVTQAKSFTNRQDFEIFADTPTSWIFKALIQFYFITYFCFSATFCSRFRIFEINRTQLSLHMGISCSLESTLGFKAQQLRGLALNTHFFYYFLTSL